jgi:diguanylate cyclase (GGDEF)-like protein
VPTADVILSAIIAVLSFGCAGLAVRIRQLQVSNAPDPRTVADDVTGVLAHRRLLPPVLADFAAESTPVVMILVNIDRFAELAARSHDVARQVLTLLAGRLAIVAYSTGGYGFRLRGDEFAFIWPHRPPADADHLAADIQNALSEPLEVLVGGHTSQITITACLGIATGAAHTATAPVLLRRSNTAILHAKQIRPGTSVTWRPDMAQLPRKRDRQLIYGVIEWESPHEPSVVAAFSVTDVERHLVRLLAGVKAEDDPTFAERHPAPPLGADPAVIHAWLTALNQATTVPWVTILEP